MTPLLALAAGWVLSKMFDVFKRGERSAPPHAPTPPHSGRRRPATTSRRPTSPPPTAPTATTRPAPPTTALATTQPVPWPQVAPKGLPSFPGAGWEPDEPPPSAVVARANQLLSALWAGGEGTFKPEQTAGRWIIYRATRMGEKKGVVAFRESRHAAFLTPPSSEPENDNASTAQASTSTTRTALPLLKRGSKGEEVRIVQRKLGLLPVDGDFGPGTEAGVKNFQARNGLTPDGKVGPLTWSKLMGSSA